MIPKNKRFSLALVLLMCLTLCLTALSEGDTEEVSITIFDENGEVVVGETPEPEVTPGTDGGPQLTRVRGGRVHSAHHDVCR